MKKIVGNLLYDTETAEIVLTIMNSEYYGSFDIMVTKNDNWFVYGNVELTSHFEEAKIRWLRSACKQLSVLRTHTEAISLILSCGEENMGLVLDRFHIHEA